MKNIISQKESFERFELPRNEALNLVKEMGEDYKVELIEGLDEDAVISFTVMVTLLTYVQDLISMTLKVSRPLNFWCHRRLLAW